MPSNRQEAAIDKLRSMIMQGVFAEGEHVQEIPLSEMLGVSRTPIREALVVLGHEGLLQYRANRGYIVRKFTMKQVQDAYLVRESLEGLACRLLAERRISASVRDELAAALAEGDRILSPGYLSEEGRRPWGLMNSRFHRTILEATNNEALIGATERVTRIPFASAEVVHWFDRSDTEGYEKLKRTHRQHHEIFEAICSGHAYQAEAKMRDHIFKTAAYIEEHYVRKTKDSGSEKVKVGAEI